MSYYVVSDFRAGLDVRRHPLTAIAGTLQSAVNCHLTPGGEIEKRKAFSLLADVPNSFGLANIGNRVISFVEPGAPPVPFPTGLNNVTFETQELAGLVAGTHRVLSWDLFDGKVYVVVETDDGGTKTVQHFYDGALVPTGKGVFVKTHQSKMYSVSEGTIWFSAVSDPTEWDDTTAGAGFINASVEDGPAAELRSIEPYYSQLAVFSQSSIQLWDMDPDPANNYRRQVFDSIGVAGRATPRQYGSGDILFLAASGVRSLQARDSSLSGAVSDIGSPIDPRMQDLVRQRPETYLDGSRTAIETRTGRFWLAFDDAIYVLSVFPGPKITAWSVYLPEWVDNAGTRHFFDVDEIVDAAGRMVLRAADGKIFLYGGPDDTEYDATEASFITPYLNLERPSDLKRFKGVDVALDGTWTVDASLDPDNLAWDRLAVLTKSTYMQRRVAMQGVSPAVAVQMKSTTASYSRVAALTIHYVLSRED